MNSNSLGTSFQRNGNTHKCKVCLKEQATKASFAPLSKERRLHLPVSIMKERFDKNCFAYTTIWM